MNRPILGLALCATLAGAASGAPRPTDFIVEVGRIRLISTDTGALRQIHVGRTQVVESIALFVTAGDKSVTKRRLAQASDDVAPLGVDIRQDDKTQSLTITRTGSIGPSKEEAVINYSQTVAITPSGEIRLAYDIEFVRELKWNCHPINVAVRVPVTFAGGKQLKLDDKPSITIPKEFDKKGNKIRGHFRKCSVAGVLILPGKGQRASVTDARSWGNYPRIYVPVMMSRRWFAGLRPIPSGTKWRIHFRMQLPMNPL